MKKYPKHMDIINLRNLAAVEVFEALEQAFKQYGKDHVSFKLDTEWEDYSDNKYATCSLHCLREMTEPEKVNYDNNRRMAALNQEQSDRALLARLKEKLGEK